MLNSVNRSKWFLFQPHKWRNSVSLFSDETLPSTGRKKNFLFFIWHPSSLLLFNPDRVRGHWSLSRNLQDSSLIHDWVKHSHVRSEAAVQTYVCYTIKPNRGKELRHLYGNQDVYGESVKQLCSIEKGFIVYCFITLV